METFERRDLYTLFEARTGMSEMTYIINVDLESANVSGGSTDCQSKLHESLGRHFDLTVHGRGCAIRGVRAVHRPPTRYWDDNDGAGDSFEAVVQTVRALIAEHPEAYPRRCRKCGVGAHLPDWD
jgi:hypothetical protein